MATKPLVAIYCYLRLDCGSYKSSFIVYLTIKLSFINNFLPITSATLICLSTELVFGLYNKFASLYVTSPACE